MFDHEEHLARQPKSDGFVEVTKISDGEPLMLRDSPDSTVSISPGTAIVKTVVDGPTYCIPWHNVAEYRIVPDSLEVRLEMLDWLRECDHDWKTYNDSSVSYTFCRWCRMLMEDLTTIEDPNNSTVPVLIARTPRIDQVAESNDGNGPTFDLLSEPKAPTPPTVTVSCGCRSEAEAALVSHDGPCVYRPSTWTQSPIDDDDSTEF